MFEWLEKIKRDFEKGRDRAYRDHGFVRPPPQKYVFLKRLGFAAAFAGTGFAVGSITSKQNHPQIGIRFANSDAAEILQEIGRLPRQPLEQACEQVVSNFLKYGTYETAIVKTPPVPPEYEDTSGWGRPGGILWNRYTLKFSP